MYSCFWVTPLDASGKQKSDAVPVYKTGYFSPERSRFHVSEAFKNGGKVKVAGMTYDDEQKALEAYDLAAKEL